MPPEVKGLAVEHGQAAFFRVCGRRAARRMAEKFMPLSVRLW
jgi:hypothetical protein